MIHNELDGFVVYKPIMRAATGLFVTLGKTGIRFSNDVIRAMNTEWLLIFTDENKQRLMVQPAKKGTVNALKLTSSGSTCNTFTQKNVIADLRMLAGLHDGERVTVWGHKCNYATTPSIIFNLKDRKEG